MDRWIHDMSYEETVRYYPSEREIVLNLRDHGFTLEEFRNDVTGKVTAQQVLDWLGY